MVQDLVIQNRGMNILIEPVKKNYGNPKHCPQNVVRNSGHESSDRIPDKISGVQKPVQERYILLLASRASPQAIVRKL